MTALMPILRRSGLLGRPDWDPFDRFFEDFELPSLFSEKTTVTPAFDVSETENELIVKADVPGINKQDIEINLSHGLLTVKGGKSRKKNRRTRSIVVLKDVTESSLEPCDFPQRLKSTRWMQPTRTAC